MRTALALFRSILFTIAFYGGSVPIVIIAFIILPFSRHRLQGMARAWGGYHYLCARTFLGIRARIDGEIPQGQVLYAIKHESFFETIELLRIFNRPAVVAKIELSRIPLWSQIARTYGMIFIDRAGGAVALRAMMTEVRRFVAEGRSIVIYPEGTSIPPGEQPPLQAGFAGLYKLAKLPVVPIALDSGHLYPRRGFIKHPGVVTYKFGEIIPAGLPREEIEARVHAAINVLNDPRRISP
ncbi:MULTISPECIES: lysophospholipid acyltransferase family protein [Blastomonas]|jgi:1-acyl-sn-glycerol-3-phosphate acyltransferase|uniref:1-acyl-sn-glycerol-3-phosphate acyltransferase n=1 Tax=Blastomonas fulva TaxID=1550728 RepID=A0ABM6M5I3_9SPHN|nr:MULTISPECIES: lysophospholipid acyltransferase family protein [Blastomonas]AOF99579.1 acyltransferase family protein [Blastomonas sp. RAC04]ASR51121.1 1-acyl-sn-glycerol-3-phosphate acyltransferase [Blastomonas fulva]MDK2756269.1 1-acyl-sn-glycerol-3-phosphate acyltransferase [Blastomonas fulva]